MLYTNKHNFLGGGSNWDGHLCHNLKAFPQLLVLSCLFFFYLRCLKLQGPLSYRTCHCICCGLLSTKPNLPLVFTFHLFSQFLVQREADLFAENDNRETPCDCAERQHHKDLALCLESQMVFSLAPEADGIETEYAALDRREVQSNILRGSRYTAFLLSDSIGVLWHASYQSLLTHHTIKHDFLSMTTCDRSEHFSPRLQALTGHFLAVVQCLTVFVQLSLWGHSLT